MTTDDRNDVHAPEYMNETTASRHTRHLTDARLRLLMRAYLASKVTRCMRCSRGATTRTVGLHQELLCAAHATGFHTEPLNVALEREMARLLGMTLFEGA